MCNDSISLSAIMVVGSRRKRAQRVLNALCSQTAVDSIEIIIVDLTSEEVSKLNISSKVSTSYLKLPDIKSFGRARAEGVREAKAPVVAFIEDHCIPEPEWGKTLIEANEGQWAAVGYAFKNANPVNYVSRSSFIADYGLWAHPAQHGSTNLLPGNNAAYKRDVLLSFGENLDTALSADFNVHETLKKHGLSMFVESRAIVAHENHTYLSKLLRANYSYCRLLASARVRTLSWGMKRRIAYGFGVLPCAPILKLIRLLYSFHNRPSLWLDLASALPVVLLTYTFSAIGESMGYLFGEGSSVEEFKHWEIEVDRGKNL